MLDRYYKIQVRIGHSGNDANAPHPNGPFKQSDHAKVWYVYKMFPSAMICRYGETDPITDLNLLIEHMQPPVFDTVDWRPEYAYLREQIAQLPVPWA